MPIVAGAVAGLAVPAVAWIVEAVIRRRCRRWPLGLGCVAVTVLLAATAPPDAVPWSLAVVLALWGTALAYVDLAVRRLPDVLVLTAYPPLGAVLVAAAVLGDRADALPRAAAAAAVCLTAYALLSAWGGMGFGDVKLAGAVGLVLGWVSWSAVLVAVVAGFALAVPAALLALARHGPGARFAFGPWLLGGALVGLATA